ncbi:ACP S-malonyltransferase [Peptostreptococcus faecalis]|uniref:ACP S-malonyltransferase n=1 Tax=Peptostreptococcus faecalis TaxID=2045015 RepID=UPI000C7C73B2|nr:ACP S-malonyltransferase [Peptostreptococcus faecalis]
MSKKVGLLFPGQGSQYEGMGKDILSSNSVSKEVYDVAKKILDSDTYSIIEHARIEDLSHTKYSQLAIFLNSLALYYSFREFDNDNIDIVCMAGLSLGEYSALCASGSIELEEAISLIKKRGEIMQEGAANRGSMSAVLKTDKSTIENIIEKSRGESILSICNINSPDQIVVGGEFDALERFEQECKKEGIKRVIRLNVEGPFHTEILKPSSEIFGKYLEKVNFKKSNEDVYSNVDSLKYTDDTDVVSKLQKQMYTGVLFQKCVENMIESGCEVFVELGPGKSLSNFVKKIDKSVKIINIQNLEDIKNLSL